MIRSDKITHNVEVLLPAVQERFSAFPQVEVLYLYGSRAGGRGDKGLVILNSCPSGFASRNPVQRDRRK